MDTPNPYLLLELADALDRERGDITDYEALGAELPYTPGPPEWPTSHPDDPG